MDLATQTPYLQAWIYALEGHDADRDEAFKRAIGALKYGLPARSALAALAAWARDALAQSKHETPLARPGDLTDIELALEYLAAALELGANCMLPRW